MPKPRRSLLAYCCLILLPRLASGAEGADSAEQVSPPETATTNTENQSPPRNSRAEELIRRGVLARHEGREQEAFELFREAYAIEPSPRARAQMALAAKSLRLYVEAEQYLNEALAAQSDTWIAQNRETLEQARDFVDKQLAWLAIRTQLEDVSVIVNGRLLGAVAAKARVRVPAGDLSVELRSAGYRPYRANLKAPAQRVTSVEVTLEREPEVRKLEQKPAASSLKLPTLAYVGGGVALAGATVGTYFGLRALSLKHERDDLCADVNCRDQRGVRADEDGRTAGLWSTVGFGVGAAGIAILTYAFIARPNDRPRPSKSEQRVSFEATPTAVRARLSFD